MTVVYHDIWSSGFIVNHINALHVFLQSGLAFFVL